MKAFVLAVALVGCSSPKHAEAPTALAPADPCHKAADQLVELMSAAAAATPEAIKEVTDKVVARCEADAWSDETKTCMIQLRDKTDLDKKCAPLMTDAQKNALVGAFGGGDGAAAGAPGGGGAAPPPPPAAPAPASTTRGPVKKPSDPCEGGQ